MASWRLAGGLVEVGGGWWEVGGGRGLLYAPDVVAVQFVMAINRFGSNRFE